MKQLGILITACLFSLSCAAQTTVYLVRHAEKDLTDKQDPALTATGQQRAHYWSQVLQHQAIKAVYSTDTLRTRSTAQPAAEAHNLDIRLYQPGQLEAAALRDRHPNSHILVVGHSNTIPDLVNRLIGDAKYSELDESEYSNLYIVTIGENSASDIRLSVELPQHR